MNVFILPKSETNFNLLGKDSLVDDIPLLRVVSESKNYCVGFNNKFLEFFNCDTFKFSPNIYFEDLK